MLRSVKIRLLPTPEQEALFRESAGVARWAYNYFLSENERIYQEYVSNGEQGRRYISGGDLRKHINNDLKPTTHKWLRRVGSNVMKQAVIDAEREFKNYLTGNKGKPKYKSRKYSKASFYVNYESLRRTDNGFKGEKIGVVKTAYALPKLPKGEKYANPRISYDGKYWYLSVGYPAEVSQEELTGDTVGIHLGMDNLAVCSDGKVFRNINHSKRVKKLDKRLKRQQHRLAAKIEENTVSFHGKARIYKKPLDNCKNIARQREKIKSTYKKLKDIRNNHIHQTTSQIVKTKPSALVVENLNVTKMLKDQYLAKAIAEQGFYEFKRQIAYKSEQYGIEVVYADDLYTICKRCSQCGNISRNFDPNDKIYRCEYCGFTLERDVNASRNLADYSEYPSLSGN